MYVRVHVCACLSVGVLELLILPYGRLFFALGVDTFGIQSSCKSKDGSPAYKKSDDFNRHIRRQAITKAADMQFLAVVLLAALACASPVEKREADADPSLPFYGQTYGYPSYYRGYGYPYSYSHALHKRSADPEPDADPSLLYNHYRPYSAGYGYVRPYTYGYPYSHAHALHKRSAEPEADASVVHPHTYSYTHAAPVVSYGYPYTYGYGYRRGYGY
ncbi:uncharacterized protein [Penaeus vannamei]|uniref:uncharacterized protein n=1 Tax=Penaeus vannamei TaxID=6689 RepID=UPI00387F6409